MGKSDSLSSDRRADPELDVEERAHTIAEALERASQWSEWTNRFLAGPMTGMLEGLRKQQTELPFAWALSTQMSEVVRRTAAQSDALRSALAKVPQVPSFAGALNEAMRAAEQQSLLYRQQHEVLLRQQESLIEGLFKHPALDDAIAAVARTQQGAEREVLRSIRNALAHQPPLNLPTELNAIMRDFFVSNQATMAEPYGAWEDVRSLVSRGFDSAEKAPPSATPGDAEREAERGRDWPEQRRAAAEYAQIASFPLQLLTVLFALIALLSRPESAIDADAALRAYAEHFASVVDSAHKSQADAQPVVVRDAPVREHPTGKARVAFRLVAGTRIDILFTSGTWSFVAKVINGDRLAFGWIFSRHLE